MNTMISRGHRLSKGEMAPKPSLKPRESAVHGGRALGVRPQLRTVPSQSAQPCESGDRALPPWPSVSSSLQWGEQSRQNKRLAARGLAHRRGL